MKITLDSRYRGMGSTLENIMSEYSNQGLCQRYPDLSVQTNRGSLLFLLSNKRDFLTHYFQIIVSPPICHNKAIFVTTPKEKGESCSIISC